MTNSSTGAAALPSLFYEDPDVRRTAAQALGANSSAEVPYSVSASLRGVALAERPSPVLFGQASLELRSVCSASVLAERAASNKNGCGTHTRTHSATGGVTRLAAYRVAESQPGDTWEFRAWCTAGPGTESSRGGMHLFVCDASGATPNQHPNGTTGWNANYNGLQWWSKWVSGDCDSEWRQLRMLYTVPYPSTASGATGWANSSAYRDWLDSEWALHPWNGIQVRLNHLGNVTNGWSSGYGTTGVPIFWDGLELRKLYTAPERCCTFAEWNAQRIWHGTINGYWKACPETC